MTAPLRALCLALALIAASACSGPVTPTPTGTAPPQVSPTSTATPSSSPTPPATPTGTATAGDIEVAGTIFTVARDERPCAAHDLAQYSTLSGVVISFRDEARAIHGSATTGELRTADVAAGCRLWTTYRATLPRLPSYRVEFDPPDPTPGPGGAYFDGVNQLTPVTITFAELEAAHFAWDFEAPQAFVAHGPRAPRGA